MLYKSKLAISPKPRPSLLTRKAQATVEFALISVVLLVILYGILEVGRLIFINSEVDNAAREGAQIAAMNPGISVNALATQVVSKMAVTDHSTIAGTPQPRIELDSPPGNCAFCEVRVTVTATWRTLVPILNWGGLTDIHATSIKLIEVHPSPAPTP